MSWPKPPRGMREVQRGNTTFDVENRDGRNVIVSQVETDGQGNVTHQTRDAMRWWRGEDD